MSLAYGDAARMNKQCGMLYTHSSSKLHLRFKIRTKYQVGATHYSFSWLLSVDDGQIGNTRIYIIRVKTAILCNTYLILCLLGGNSFSLLLHT